MDPRASATPGAIEAAVDAYPLLSCGDPTKLCAVPRHRSRTACTSAPRGTRGWARRSSPRFRGLRVMEPPAGAVRWARVLVSAGLASAALGCAPERETATPAPSAVSVPANATLLAAATTSAATSSSRAPAPPPPPPELPRGGRTLFPDYRLVGFCGTPGAPALGRAARATCREQGAKKLARVRGPVRDGTTRKVLPVFELIAVVVQAGAGADGKYRAPRRRRRSSTSTWPRRGRQGPPPAQHPARPVRLSHRGAALRALPSRAGRRRRARSRVGDAAEADARTTSTGRPTGEAINGVIALPVRHRHEATASPRRRSSSTR